MTPAASTGADCHSMSQHHDVGFIARCTCSAGSQFAYRTRWSFLDRTMAAGRAPSRAVLVATGLNEGCVVTVAPITTTIKGLSSEGEVGAHNGLDHDCVVSPDDVLTVPANTIGRTVRQLNNHQDLQLARTVVLAYDLELPLLE